MSRVLLIFTKNPRLGRVKTRLAQTLGNAEALRIYRFLLEKTREATLGVVAQRWLFYSDWVEAGDEWPEKFFRKFVQWGPELGARMQDAFQRAFDTGAKKAIIIGSDCPELSSALLEEAFSRLEDHDMVLGPSTDGGYYLLGMKSPAPALFRGIAWSTDTVCAATLEKIQAAGKSVFLLPELTDVDTEADWRQYQLNKTATSQFP